jgi:hypothetical protein
MCVFEGRAGSTARAVFDSQEQAMRFAERHTQTMHPAATLIEWQHVNGESVADVPAGHYRILRVVDA